MREPLQHTRYIYNVLFTIEVVLGVSIILVTIAYQKILNAFLVALERKMLVAKFFNTYVLGFQLVACYLCSLSMWQRLWTRRYTPTLEILLGIWLFFCFLIIISGIATTWSMLYSANSLVNSAELMLFRGIDLYYENPEWKLLWDQLQYGEQCCGVKSYKDWMAAKWMPKSKHSSTPQPKKERPNKRAKRSTHRRYHHYPNLPKPDSSHYFEPLYSRNYETFEEFPYSNPYQEYVRYGVHTNNPLIDTAFERNLNAKNLLRATDLPIIATHTDFNVNINPVADITEPAKIYSSTVPTVQSTTTTSTTTARVTQHSKTTTNGTKLCKEHVFAPYACCKKNNPACYKHYMPLMGNPANETIPHLDLDDINNNGCLPLFVRHMSYMMAILVVLLMLAILVDVALCSLTKFIMIRNLRESKLMGDNTPLCDDNGNALVLVKCPPNVKCITLEDRDRRCDCDHDFETPQVGSCIYCSTTHVCNECTQCRDPSSIIATENTLLIP